MTGLHTDFDEGYCAVCHPTYWHQMPAIDRRERWRGAYRAWRLADRPPVSTLQQLFDKFEPGSVLTGEIGTVFGVRILEAG